jgi:hypothetical protein
VYRDKVKPDDPLAGSGQDNDGEGLEDGDVKIIVSGTASVGLSSSGVDKYGLIDYPNNNPEASASSSSRSQRSPAWPEGPFKPAYPVGLTPKPSTPANGKGKETTA